MLFRKNVAMRFSCSSDELSGMLHNDKFLSQAGLKRGEGDLLIAVNPTPWSRDSFLPQISIRILSDPNGCSLIASFSLQKIVRTIMIVLLSVSAVFDCILLAGSTYYHAAGFVTVFLIPLLWIIFLGMGSLLFRKNVKDIVGNLMRISNG